jgi:hypothetical protein
MRKQYGSKQGTSVFYASKNKGTITGVDAQGPPLDEVQTRALRSLLAKAPSYDAFRRLVRDRIKPPDDKGPIGMVVSDSPGTTPITGANSGPVAWHDRRRHLRIFRDALRAGMHVRDAFMLATRDDDRPPSRIVDISEHRDPRGTVVKREHHTYFSEPKPLLGTPEPHAGMMGRTISGTRRAKLRQLMARRSSDAEPVVGTPIISGHASPVHTPSAAGGGTSAGEAAPEGHESSGGGEAHSTAHAEGSEHAEGGEHEIAGARTIEFFKRESGDTSTGAASPQGNLYMGDDIKRRFVRLRQRRMRQ